MLSAQLCDLHLTLARQVTENSVTLVQENQQPHVFAFDHVGATPVLFKGQCKVCFRCVIRGFLVNHFEGF